VDRQLAALANVPDLFDNFRVGRRARTHTVTDRDITFFHAPNSRSSCTLFLLEELGVAYDLHPLSLDREDHKASDYLAVNPMGKVPAIRHGETVITELGAVTLYLGDLFAETGLCPQPGDPLRGSLLRWLFFYGNCVEPAVLQKAMNWPDPPKRMAGYGSFDDVMAAIVGRLEEGPWFLGERFTVADGLWGPALGWLTRFGMAPKAAAVADYVARIEARPATARVRAIDAELAEKFAAG
jgi:glutathione S-transferase